MSLRFMHNTRVSLTLLLLLLLLLFLPCVCRANDSEYDELVEDEGEEEEDDDYDEEDYDGYEDHPRDDSRKYRELFKCQVIRHVPQKDQLQGHETYTAVLPSNAETDDGWSLIRIGVSYVDLYEESENYCKEKGKVIKNFKYEDVKCEDKDVITPEKNSTLLNKIIPGAIQLHASRLRINRTWKRDAEDNLTISMPLYSVCTDFTMPFSTVQNCPEVWPKTDFVLYVASKPGSSFAQHCTEEPKTNRPTSAVMNFDPSRIADTRYSVRIAAHEIAHGLGFLLTPFGDRTRYGYFSSRQVHFLTSNKVREMVKQHYNCNEYSVFGMELEDEECKFSSPMHWERRIAKDELMSPYVGVTGAMLYTNLTLALFEDLGYYKPVYELAEPMTWGKNAGCALFKWKCVEHNKSKYPNMFCNDTSAPPRCTSDRYGLGTCRLSYNPYYLPPRYQYFNKFGLSGTEDSLTDRCPVITPTAQTLCDGGTADKMPGSVLGSSSRCVHGKSITLKTSSSNSTARIGDVCVNVRCSCEELQVQYKGDDNWYKCPAGKWLKLSGNDFESGAILCPAYDEICTDVPRPKAAAHDTNCKDAKEGSFEVETKEQQEKKKPESTPSKATAPTTKKDETHSVPQIPSTAVPHSNQVVHPVKPHVEVPSSHAGKQETSHSSPHHPSPPATAGDELRSGDRQMNNATLRNKNESHHTKDSATIDNSRIVGSANVMNTIVDAPHSDEKHVSEDSSSSFKIQEKEIPVLPGSATNHTDANVSGAVDHNMTHPINEQVENKQGDENHTKVEMTVDAQHANTEHQNSTVFNLQGILINRYDGRREGSSTISCTGAYFLLTLALASLVLAA